MTGVQTCALPILKQSKIILLTSRKAALKRHANISIQLQNIQIYQNKDTANINFIQTFKSNGFSDIGIKELVWVKNGSGWRIIKETWIPYKKTT